MGTKEYFCGNCRHQINLGTYRCPRCNVILSGVREYSGDGNDLYRESRQPTQPTALEAWVAEGIAKGDHITMGHVWAAVLFPYVALPWGIINLCRGKKRSGLFMVLWVLMYAIAWGGVWLGVW